MFAAPILIDRLMTNYSAGASGNGKRIKSKMAAKYRDKRTSITTVRDQYPSYDIFPTHLIFHYPLPLSYRHSAQRGHIDRHFDRTVSREMLMNIFVLLEH